MKESLPRRSLYAEKSPLTAPPSKRVKRLPTEAEARVASGQFTRPSPADIIGRAIAGPDAADIAAAAVHSTPIPPKPSIVKAARARAAEEKKAGGVNDYGTVVSVRLDRPTRKSLDALRRGKDTRADVIRRLIHEAST